MLSIKIEKEVKHDQEIAFGLNARKTVCVLCGGGIAFLMWLVTNVSISQLIPAFVVLAVIFGAFGWIEKDGAHLEDYIIQRTKTLIYGNEKLMYRTSNRYIRMLNAGYRKIRQAANADKKSGKKDVKKKRPKEKSGKARITIYS